MRKAALRPLAASASATAMLIFAIAFAGGVFALALVAAKWSFGFIPSPPSRPTDALPSLAVMVPLMRGLFISALLALALGIGLALLVDRLPRAAKPHGGLMAGRRTASSAALLFRDVRAGAYLFAGATLTLTLFALGLLATRYLSVYLASVHDMIPPYLSAPLLVRWSGIFGIATVVYFVLGLLAGFGCRETT